MSRPISSVSSSVIDLSFPHSWLAEVLAARPAILPMRQFVYPRQAEEIERGALEVMVQPGLIPGSVPGPVPRSSSKPGSSAELSPGAMPFLATCALGFRDPLAPTGLWSTPEPNEICAVSGGYAYLIDTTAPERFTMIPYRPVLEVRALPGDGLLLFVGHRSILGWGRKGQAWESERLSDEGVTIAEAANGVLRGTGWEMRTDKETHFTLDLGTGLRIET